MCKLNSLQSSPEKVELNKIRLAQLDILLKGEIGPSGSGDSDSQLAATPGSLGIAKIISAKKRMSQGDKFYMENDFVSCHFEYTMALLRLEDPSSVENYILETEVNQLRKQVLSRLGQLCLQSVEKKELNKSLEYFHQCLQLNKTGSGHKDHVFIAVTQLLVGDKDGALHTIQKYMRLSQRPKPMFIAVTDLDAQQIISRNLQERLEGHELTFIDNHVYQGKVNFLHLTSVNYQWVKSQANDEMIEINRDLIPESTIRANVLQFPVQRAHTNKCLVVVFSEGQMPRNRHISDGTNITGTCMSLSSFNDGIMDFDDNESYEENEKNRQQITLVDSVYQNMIDISSRVLHKTKINLFQSLLTSVFDRLF